MIESAAIVAVKVTSVEPFIATDPDKSPANDSVLEVCQVEAVEAFPSNEATRVAPVYPVPPVFTTDVGSV